MTCGSVAVACVYDNPLNDTEIVSLVHYVVSFFHDTNVAHGRDNVKSIFPVSDLTRCCGYAMVVFNNKGAINKLVTTIIVVSVIAYALIIWRYAKRSDAEGMRRVLEAHPELARYFQ